VQVLVAPAGFDGRLRATEVAAAIGRGLEAAGLEPPDLCPVADGGPGTLEVLLTRLGGDSLAVHVGGSGGAGGPRGAGEPGGLGGGGGSLEGLGGGGESFEGLGGDRGGRGRPGGPGVDVGFGVIGDGSAAIVELAAIGRAAAIAGVDLTTGSGVIDPTTQTTSSSAVGELIAAAAQTGAGVVVVAAGGTMVDDGGEGLVAAVADAGGLGGARVVVLCPIRPHFVATRPGHGGEPGGIAEILSRAFGATVEPGGPFVLEAVGFDARMRAARAVIVGEAELDLSALTGRVLGEAATRARQAGVPCHAIVGVNRLDRFDARILDLQEILEARTLDDLATAATILARLI
jgi:glycerate kinase